MTSTTAPAAARATRFPLRALIVLHLAELAGPAAGIHDFGRDLIWSGSDDCARVDLVDLNQVAIAYEAVLDAARSPRDIAANVNAGLLERLWPTLGMNPARRRAWEAANPELAAARAAHADAKAA